MNSSETILQELLALLYRSLARYLAEVGVWTRSGNGRAHSELTRLAADQQELSLRIAGLLSQRCSPPSPPPYSMAYMDKAFLSLDYLLPELIDTQRATVERIRQLLPQLVHDAEALALAEEALGNSRGHLENLEQLQAERRTAGGLS